MGLLAAVLICAYTIAKVLRDALFLAEFGALALPYAYIGVAIASVGFVWIEGFVARRTTRVRASQFSQYLAMACSIAAAVLYPLDHRITTAAFYVWTGSQAMMLLPHFWTLALDVWDSRRARRLFPLLAGCGLIGGLAGGGFSGWASPFLQRVGLMWSLPVLLLVAHGLTRMVESHRRRTDPAQDAVATASPWKIIGRSPYIRVFVVVLALSVIVGTLVDFQFKLFLRDRFHNPIELTHFLGRFYVVLNVLSLVFQFGIAGWLLQRLGLGVATGLQPAAVLALSLWLAVTPAMWIMTGLRWIQGGLSQTLGKSTNEIYYTAIRPTERRRIKPAIDTLVERWSDAAVGVLLIVVLHALHAPIAAIVVITAVLSALWIVALVALDRQYGRAFQQVLSTRWIEPDETSDVLRVPAARRTLLAALSAADERGIVFALRLSGQVRDPRIAGAVRECLGHASPDVRAAAVSAMEAMRLDDRENRIEGFLGDSHEGLRRAAVAYLLVRGPDPVAFAHRALDGADPGLRTLAVDALFERPLQARDALTLPWLDALVSSHSGDDHLLAARALGAMNGPALVPRMRTLLADPDLEVRRLVLSAMAHHPARELLDLLPPLLLTPGLNHEAVMALAAIGEPAVPGLEQLLQNDSDWRAQSLGARALAQIGGRRAIRALVGLVRGHDVRLRYLGLRGLTRLRARTGTPLLPREVVHRMFLRELREYRDNLDPALALESHVAAEVRLLALSFQESANMALERAVQALSCWYEPKPLIGVLDRLKSREREQTSPALDYLEHILPRATFGPVRKIFEEPALAFEGADAGRDPLAVWIETAWKSEDGWLRACAVRASRHALELDPAAFADADDDPRVRAELDARRTAGPRWHLRPPASPEPAC
jgi:ATP/ADP translocase/HEAT repeat protein